MYRHKREKHSAPRQRCTDCDYSHIYPNRVKMHYNRVHRGMKRRSFYEKCRREFCEYAGTTNCLELQSHRLFFCEKCQLSFERSDNLKRHKDKIHEGLIFNCEYFCKEEGCTFIFRSAFGLKQHVERKHEGIIRRLKCHVVNCNFETTWNKNLRDHAHFHLPESLKIEAKLHKKKRAIVAPNPIQPMLIECVEEGCNAKVRNIKSHMKVHLPESLKIEAKLHGMNQTRIPIQCVEKGCDAKVGNIKRHMKLHIASAQTSYICKLEICNFETHSKRYLVKHMKRCKLQDA